LEERVGAFGRKTWRVTAAAGQPPLAFSYDEAPAPYPGGRRPEPLAGTPAWEAARQALGKVQAPPGQPAPDSLARFPGLFPLTAPGALDDSARADLIDRLQVAVEDAQDIRLLYRSEQADAPWYRGVHPYGSGRRADGTDG